MRDRELLEMAAKAAGIFWDRLEDCWHDSNGHVRGDWNPLTDDGDALRLAAKCHVKTEWGDGTWLTCSVKTAKHLEVFDAGGEAAALRSAIVRAAAEIGRAMP